MPEMKEYVDLVSSLAVFVHKFWISKPSGKNIWQRQIWEDNIKMNLKEIVFEHVKWLRMLFSDKK
jgi:hypothetical protein